LAAGTARRTSARRVAAARAGGSGSVNVDLLYDVPGGSVATWMTTLDAAIALEPDHLSLYALTLDDPDAEGLTGPAATTSDHGRRPTLARRRPPEQDEDRAAAEYHTRSSASSRRLAGLRDLELGRPGHESRHNLVYWDRRPYEAVGPARTPSTA
jgi:oxygen-independent coproporphyrinogen-3 oxidase